MRRSARNGVRYEKYSCSRLAAVTVMVRPRYLPPPLSRSSMVLASKLGSNCLAMCVIAVTKPFPLTPTTLIGKALG